jgi:uncharacterized membrane protein required for colicin V production
MNALDIIFLIFSCIILFFGLKNGLIKISVFFGACIFGWILAGIFEPNLSKFFPEINIDNNIISGLIYFTLISITILISNILLKPIKSLLTIFTFGLTSFVDKIGGLLIGLIFSFLVTSIILISLSRVTYHFEVSDQNKIYDYASETPLVKNKINNIENQIQNSIISKFAIKSIKSLNLHQLPIIPGTFTNSFEILYSNTNK